ncbi:MAG: UDP-N-acetylglucosamine 2-epimerase (non-hydrolyzing) [Bacteroidia bacterium]
MKKILTVVGARPQFIKAAVISRAISQHEALTEVLVHTGQHYDYNMSEIFFEELGIPAPAYNLGVGSGSHGEQTGQMLIGLEQVMRQEQPDIVLIYGDTNSTLAAALAAAKLHIPVAHVEAGLRSFNKRMPEEVNRIMADHVSTWLFCPTEVAVTNLHDENIRAGVHLVGDVMYDSALFFAGKDPQILAQHSLESKAFALATVHRAENTDDPQRLRAIFDALAAAPMPVVLPAHPRLCAYLHKYDLHPGDRVLLIDPVAYGDMVQLEQHAACILTDSGGVQKEAYFFRTPCITLRDETEWVETVASGWNTLTGTDTAAIVAAMHQRRQPAEHPAFYGTGRAGSDILQILTQASVPADR